MFSVLLLLGAAMPASALDEPFDASSIPSDWLNAAWAPGGAASVASGRLTIDGARTGTSALHGAGRSLEFVATYTGDAWQHIGFGVDYNDGPWITFSTFAGGQMYARTRTHLGQLIDTPLGADLLGTAHRYRIDWNADGIAFSVDGVLVATHATAVDASLRPLASDFNVGGGRLEVRSIAMFTSVTRTGFADGQLPAGWFTATWSEGGAATLAHGRLAVDSARAGTEATFGAGRSVEYVATFTGAAWQHAGFGVDYYAAPWAIFTTAQGGRLYARTWSESGEQVTTPIPGHWLGAAHRYRIDWRPTQVVFSIDGAVVATHAITIGAPQRVLISDFEPGGGLLEVDELELTVPDFTLDFAEASVPAGWSSSAWHAGGSARIAGGTLTVDGASSGTAVAYGPGRVLELDATFTGDPWQHIGFGVDYDVAPWIIFSTYQGGGLYARSWAPGGAVIDTRLDGEYLGTSHRYRIEWGESAITFSIDGVVVATHETAIGASARVLISDFETGGGALTVDALTLTP